MKIINKWSLILSLKGCDQEEAQWTKMLKASTEGRVKISAIFGHRTVVSLGYSLFLTEILSKGDTKE